MRSLIVEWSVAYLHCYLILLNILLSLCSSLSLTLLPLVLIPTLVSAVLALLLYRYCIP